VSRATRLIAEASAAAADLVSLRCFVSAPEAVGAAASDDAAAGGGGAFTDPGGSADAHAALERWLAAGTPPASYPRLSLRSYGGTSRGVHTRAPVPAEGDLLLVPRAFLLTAEAARASAAGATLAAAGRDAALSAVQQTYLAVHLLLERARGPASPHAPYIAALPAALPHLPLFWSAAELRALAGSHLLAQLAERRAALAADYALVCAALPRFAAAASARDFCWARAIVGSRNFSLTVDGRRTEALVPLADMVNHARPRASRWYYDSRRAAFVLQALAPLAAEYVPGSHAVHTRSEVARFTLP
jgi:histone-lysine N-methyltransferase SETD3